MSKPPTEVQFHLFKYTIQLLRGLGLVICPSKDEKIMAVAFASKEFDAATRLPIIHFFYVFFPQIRNAA